MKVNFTEYKPILEAEVVSIYDLLKYFKKADMDYDQWGNVYVNFRKETKGTPIMVAHTDNVLHGIRTPVLTLDGKRIIGGNGVGIGFDDKAGIIGAIEIWKRMNKKGMRIIFTADEEVGGLGASHVPDEKLKDAAYIVELDRRGRNDVIDVSGDTRLASDEFVKIWEALGFKTATGTFTDLNEFKEKAPQVNMVNLSCGYYNPHTNGEYLEIEEFESVVDKVYQMISTHPDVIVDDTPEEPKKKYDNYSKYGNSLYDRYYDWDDKLHNYYDTCGECAYCGAIVKDNEGIMDEEGNVFCDEQCEKYFREMLEYEAEEDEQENK